MTKYTIKSQIETFLGITIDENIDYIINSAEKYIDNFTGRNFVADTEASARLYNGNNSQNLLIDDCIEVTKVEIGNDQYGDSFTEVVVNTGVKVLPINNLVKKLPFWKIHLRSNVFGAGLGNQQITAKWGYTKVAPDDIIWVAIFLSASIYKLGSGGNVGGVSGEKIGEYSVSFKSEQEMADFNKATGILDNYKERII